MNRVKKVFMILLGLLLVSSPAAAGDFDWMKGFNIRAEADHSGFRARLESRFKIGDVEIKTVLSNVEKPADAYMLLRLGELSNQPLDRVIEHYKAEKHKGWGVFAKRLGIKPGSKEFHALKQGQDLYVDKGKSEGKAKRKNKAKGKSKGKSKKGQK